MPLPPGSIPPEPPPRNLDPAECPPIEDVNGKLTDCETEVILMRFLNREHRTDPNILRFIASYMRHRNVRQAQDEAGLPPKSGRGILNRKDIFACIQALTQKSMMKYGFDAHEVVEAVKEIAYVDPADLFHKDGTHKQIHDIAPEVRRAIKKYKVKNLYENDPNGMPRIVGQLFDIELWSKEKAVELLGREKELFVEKKVVEHDVTGNMAAILLDSKRRADDRQRQIQEARQPVVLEIEARKVEANEA